MYSETQFINKYNSLKLTTFTDFMKTARVSTGSQLLPIKDYLKTKNISSQQLKLLFEFIKSKEIYLRTFYKKSMNPYELHIKAAPSKEYNNNQLVQYKNIIRNQFYRQIMEKTKPGTENIRTYGELLDNLFNRLIIDYKLLTPSALHYLEQGRLGSVFSSYYFRASIMNPYLVYSLQETLLKGTRVFSPTLGWGSYCYGFLESNKMSIKIIFTWWNRQTFGTFLKTLFFGNYVGKDELGNKYYKNKQDERWVIYSDNIEATKILPR